jgi:hypothetical protein
MVLQLDFAACKQDQQPNAAHCFTLLHACQGRSPVVMLALLLLPGAGGSCPTTAAAHPCSSSSSSSGSSHTSRVGECSQPTTRIPWTTCQGCYKCVCLHSHPRCASEGLNHACCFLRYPSFLGMHGNTTMLLLDVWLLVQKLSSQLLHYSLTCVLYPTGLPAPGACGRPAAPGCWRTQRTAETASWLPPQDTTWGNRWQQQQQQCDGCTIDL